MELFDKDIKERVDKISSAVPADMWSRIEQELDTPKKDNKLLPIIYWSLAVLTLLGLLYGWYTFQNNNKPANQPTHIAIAANSIGVHNVSTTDDDYKGTKSIQNTEKNTEKNVKNIASASPNDTPLASSSKQLSANKDFSIEKSSKNSIQTMVIEKENYKVTTDAARYSSLGVDRGSLGDDNRNTRIIKNTVRNNSLDHPSSYTSIMKDEELSIVPNHTTLLNNNFGLSSPSFKTLRTESRPFISSPTSILPFTMDGLNLDIEEISMVAKPSKVREPDCPDTRESVNENFLFEMHINPLYDVSILESKSNSFDEYPGMRNATETKQFSYNLGFRTGFKNEKGFMFSTGLEFTQLNTRFNKIDSAATKKTTIIDTTFNTDGSVKEVSTSTITIYGTNEIKAYNYMTMLDIPLLFSYEMPFGRRTTLNFTTGAFLNLNFAHEARILDPDDLPQWVSSSSDKDYHVYKDGLGISFYFAAGINYRISKKWHVLVRPNVRLYSENFTIGSYPLSERHQLFGLRTGVRYLF